MRTRRPGWHVPGQERLEYDLRSFIYRSLIFSAERNKGIWAVRGTALADFATLVARVFVDTSEGRSLLSKPELQQTKAENGERGTREGQSAHQFQQGANFLGRRVTDFYAELHHITEYLRPRQEFFFYILDQFLKESSFFPLLIP